MRTILVLNPKGGCGKSTMATNLAGYYAQQGKNVALADCDPQGSSREWLKIRPEHLSSIEAADIGSNGLQISKSTEILILDSPAALHDQKLVNIIRAAQTVIVPILPSPIDIRAAENFLKELYNLRNRIKRKVKIATVANRVREDTLMAAKLDYYLEKLRLPNGSNIPFMTVLRASQNYINAAEKGMTIFELPPSKTYYDREQWEPLLKWLNSKRSIPG